MPTKQPYRLISIFLVTIKLHFFRCGIHHGVSQDFPGKTPQLLVIGLRSQWRALRVSRHPVVAGLVAGAAGDAQAVGEGICLDLGVDGYIGKSMGAKDGTQPPTRFLNTGY